MSAARCSPSETKERKNSPNEATSSRGRNYQLRAYDDGLWSEVSSLTSDACVEHANDERMDVKFSAGAGQLVQGVVKFTY